ncbi:MAG: hypothetical protein IJT87_06365, partial [Ruminiclostridium sp.]|nr:hypothetical protein [Ruminiclostridium sp.]
MKRINKIMSVALALTMTASVAAGTVVSFAEYDVPELSVSDDSGSIAINKTNFPDEYFREYITKKFDDDEDGYLSQEEINEATDVELGYWYNTEKITDLTGIGYLTSMTTLKLVAASECLIENIDLRKNTALQILYCVACSKLAPPDLSKNTELIEFDCSQCNFNSIDVSHNTKLEKLDCSYNKLKKLDISANKALKWLCCKQGYSEGNVMLTELDTSKNTELEYLEIQDYYSSSNKIKNLDLSKNLKLKTLICCGLGLEKLDVSKNVMLEKLVCGNNNIVTLDIKKNTALKVIGCEKCGLKELDVSKNTQLTDLGCGNNMLTELDISKLTQLETLYIPNNFISEIDVSNCVSLEGLTFPLNRIKHIDLSHNKKLKYLVCWGNRLEKLDVTNNPELGDLEIGTDYPKGYIDSPLLEENGMGNKIKYINLTFNKKLYSLHADRNMITSIDVSGCTEGIFEGKCSVYCYGNEYYIGKVSSFDLSVLPGFDSSKASEWSGAVYDSTTNTIINFTSDKITYKYDCGQNNICLFTLLVQDEPKPKGNVVVTYNGKTEVFADLNSLEKNKAYLNTVGDITIELFVDVTAKKFTIPKKASMITLIGNNHTFTVPNISANCDLTLENITLKTAKGTAAAVTAKKALTVTNCTLGTVKAAANLTVTDS